MSEDNLILLYTGSNISAGFLKEMLEEKGIGAMVRNDMKSGLAAGFAAAPQESAARLFVAKKDEEAAKVVLKDFKKKEG